MATPGVTTRQIKAARALLGWSQTELAAASGLSIPTIKRIEARSGGLGGRPETSGRIVAALEQAGADFIAADGGGGVGVRLRGSGAPGVIALENLNASNDD